MDEELLKSWPSGLDVVVLPGFPRGADPPGLPEGESPYPDTTADFLKLLRERGLSVDYAQPHEKRAVVAQWSDDFIAPVLAFTAQALASGAGELLADIVRNRIDSLRLTTTKLRVKVGRHDEKTGETFWFDGEGPADQVLEAMKRGLKG
jgi:hypothetical protein